MPTFTIKHDNPKRSDVCRKAVQEMQRWHEAGRDFEVVVKEPKRGGDQNRALHAVIAELSRKLEWAGEKRDAETWKRLLVASWFRTEGKSAQYLPALDGHGVDIVPVRTSRLTKKDCGELIDWITWFGTEHGVRWDARETG